MINALEMRIDSPTMDNNIIMMFTVNIIAVPYTIVIVILYINVNRYICITKDVLLCYVISKPYSNLSYDGFEK